MTDKKYPIETKNVAEQKHFCSSCKKEVGEFNSRDSAREYEISGLCQSCQDKAFG